jgi:group I intron endonuclease
MRNKVCGIYKITSPSGSVYIGQSTDIKSRFSKYRKAVYLPQPRLLKSLQKYGVNNHTFEIIQECDKDDLNNLEKYWIEKYKSFNTEHGLNLQSGGHNHYSFTDEVRKKQSETRRKLGIRPPVNYGKDNVNYGKPVSEERKLKQRNSLKKHYLTLNKEDKDKLSKKLSDKLKERWKNNPNWRINKFGKNHHNSKPILQLSKDGVVIKEWESQREAARELKIDFRNLSSYINRERHRKDLGGFFWKFK